MLEQYGQQIMEKPEGMFRAVHFKSMGQMDTRTGDGRLLQRGGRGVRELPRPIFSQEAQGMGHEGAVPAGRIDAIQFHDDGNIEGWGWLLDNEAGRKAALHIATKVQFHGSMDLAETKVKLDIAETDDGNLELLIDFTDWRIAAHTIVGKPAFADTPMELIEVTAALQDDGTPLECEFSSFDVRTVGLEEELTAAAAVADATVVPWADFHVPESENYQKIVIDSDLRVYGHLGLWDLPDDVNPNVRVPRCIDGYASFNQSGPLTELGPVETGPIFFQGGHPLKPLGGRNPYEAYGGVENAWCDVRVVAGRFGPWISGRVRPGVSDEVVYAARASRISGHWVGDRLRAIVSVNVPRFNVPGSGKFQESFYDATYDDEGKMLELVASFPPFLEEAAPTAEPEPVEEVVEVDYTAEAEAILMELELDES